MDWVKASEDLPDQGVVVLIQLDNNKGYVTGWLESGNEWCFGNLNFCWDFLCAHGSHLIVEYWAYI
jgi:hypothetical protein